MTTFHGFDSVSSVGCKYVLEVDHRDTVIRNYKTIIKITRYNSIVAVLVFAYVKSSLVYRPRHYLHIKVS